MNRRNFFGALAGVPLVASAAVAIAQQPVSGIAIARQLAPSYPKLDERTIQEIIDRAMRMLGVIAPGESLSQNQREVCRTVLNWIMRDWRLKNGPFTASALAYELAFAMAPEFYRPRDGWNMTYIGRPKRYRV